MLPTTPEPEPEPDTVTDPMLWRMAVRVTADHQPHPRHPGRCANLRCVHEAYPCPPLRDAQRAQQAAIRPHRFMPGRARVIGVAAAAQRFVGWFRPARPVPPAPVPLPRRQPMATLGLAA